MSKFNLIAIAIAASLATPAAFATTVSITNGTTAGPEVLASNLFVDETVDAINYSRYVDVVANATSVYLGRNTGYNIRLTLSQGEFVVDPAAVAVSNGVTGAAVPVAGGGAGANTVTYSVTPAAGGVVEGDGIRITAGAIQIEDVEALGAGGEISAAVQVFDPVGGNQLGATINAVLIRTIEGWKVVFTPGASTQRIDVGAASAKTLFGDATVGSGDLDLEFNAGTVAVTTAALTDTTGLDTSTAKVDLSVAGANFAAFKAVTGGNGGSVYLSDAACTAPGVVLTVAADNQSAKISGETVDDVNGSSVCFDGNSIDQIAAQTISATAEVTDATLIDSPEFADDLLAMTYNGAVEYVWHFNPASNADQQSYLRLTNTSSTAGLVTVESTCDSGVVAGDASLTVAAGQSVLLTAGDIENGNAAKGVTGGTGGCATGKNRLEITGEFGSMQVQNFLRNTTSAGLINTNVNNEK
ncbi:MAG: hypothetical protein ACREO4_15030 [Lysobacter sp.]